MEEKEENQNQEGKEKRTPRPPDYKSSTGGTAVWKDTTKNGKEYLHIHLEGHRPIYAYKY